MTRFYQLAGQYRRAIEQEPLLYLHFCQRLENLGLFPIAAYHRVPDGRQSAASVRHVQRSVWRTQHQHY